MSRAYRVGFSASNALAGHMHCCHRRRTCCVNGHAWTSEVEKPRDTVRQNGCSQTCGRVFRDSVQIQGLEIPVVVALSATDEATDGLVGDLVNCQTGCK